MRLRMAQRHALVFRLPVVGPLFPRVWGTVDEDPEPAKIAVCIAETHCTLLGTEEHLRAAIGDSAAQVRCTICSCGCRLWLCPHSAKREKGRERERERQKERCRSLSRLEGDSERLRERRL